MASLDDITIKWSYDPLDSTTVYISGRGEIVSPKCKHDIERGKCLHLECAAHSGIPVRGEKSWDSALQPPSGGTYQSLFQSLYRTLSQYSIPMSWSGSVFSPTYGLPEKSPSQPEPDATTRMMPVIGYRGWKVSRSPQREEVGRFVKGPSQIVLHSLNGGEWARGEVTQAKCKAYPHKAPNYHCECGLYVLSQLAEAPRWYGGQWPDGVIVGAVVGWGDVVQHGNEGWRAEYARPIAFLDTALFKDEPLVEAAAQQYGVPVLGRKSLQLLAKEYGEAFA